MAKLREVKIKQSREAKANAEVVGNAKQRAVERKQSKSNANAQMKANAKESEVKAMHSTSEEQR